MWSFDPDLATESWLIGSFNDFSKSRDLNVMTSSSSCLTNATVQNLVTMTLTDKELQYFTRVTWSDNNEVIGSLKVSMNLIRHSYQPYCPNLVTINLDDRELNCFIKVTWSFNYKDLYNYRSSRKGVKTFFQSQLILT